jgi:hypothetical protein
MARAGCWNHNGHYQPAIYRKSGSGAPILDPELSWREVRAEAARLLPGVRYRRLMLWRYSQLWTKPPDWPLWTKPPD